jgi:CubicO group peptidase (beta-lactamase class C family)
VDASAEFIERWLRKQDTRGLGTHAVGVFCSGSQTVLIGSPVGARKVDGEPLFEIGSLTKVLTGTLLAEHCVCGDLDLDDPLTRHLDASQIPCWRDRVPTLEELATHRAALPNTTATRSTRAARGRRRRARRSLARCER